MVSEMHIVEGVRRDASGAPRPGFTQQPLVVPNQLAGKNSEGAGAFPRNICELN